jgi:hypothetical protein
LEQVKTTTYNRRYPALKARMLFPVSHEINPGAAAIVYHIYDQVGVAKVIADYADDLPRVDVIGEEVLGKIKGLGAAYGYSTQEIRAANYAGMPLEQRRANAAHDAIEQLINRLAFVGDANYGLVGIINHPNIPHTTVPADGTGSTTTWSTKNPAQIVRDFGLLINNVLALTKGVEQVNTVLLPIEQYQLVATTQNSAASDTTILNFVRANYPGVTFESLAFELDGAGVDNPGADVAIAYNRDPQKVTLEIPMEFMQHEPEKRNLEYVVDCEARFAGVRLYYPLSAHIIEGI